MRACVCECESARGRTYKRERERACARVCERERSETCIAKPSVLTLQEQVAVQPKTASCNSCGTAVVGLHPATRNHCVATLLQYFGKNILKLSHFVACVNQITTHSSEHRSQNTEALSESMSHHRRQHHAPTLLKVGLGLLVINQSLTRKQSACQVIPFNREFRSHS